MFTIPVSLDENGAISASDPAPADAICTITTPDGCEVYTPGDEQMLAERLQVSSEEQNKLYFSN